MAQIVTITNPLTGQPAQVDQLGHTAQQIDDGLNIARGVSNPNLLDNWYFGNPVDQRGGYVVPPGTTIYDDTDCTVFYNTVGSYTKIFYVNEKYGEVTWDGTVGAKKYVKRSDMIRGYTGAGYGLDRWKMYDLASVLIYDDGIILTTNGTQYGRIVQLMDAKFKAGMVVTLSVLVEEMSTTGAWYMELSYQDTSGTEKYIGYTLLSVGLNMVTVNIPDDYDSKYPMIARFPNNRTVAGDMIKLKAAKLELGSQQTLAHQENGVWVLNEIPNYGEQLRRCQRYFCRMYCKCPPKNSTAKYDYQNGGFIAFPVTMRTNPSGSLISKEASTIRLGETTVNGFDVGGADNYSRSFVADFTADL